MPVSGKNGWYLPEEDNGAVEGGSKVEGGVGVTLAGGAFAEVADDHQPVLRALERVRRTHGWLKKLKRLLAFRVQFIAFAKSLV